MHRQAERHDHVEPCLAQEATVGLFQGEEDTWATKTCRAQDEGHDSTGALVRLVTSKARSRKVSLIDGCPSVINECRRSCQEMFFLGSSAQAPLRTRCSMPTGPADAPSLSLQQGARRCPQNLAIPCPKVLKRCTRGIERWPKKLTSSGFGIL